MRPCGGRKLGGLRPPAQSRRRPPTALRSGFASAVPQHEGGRRGSTRSLRILGCTTPLNDALRDNYVALAVGASEISQKAYEELAPLAILHIDSTAR
jgi:hypothetical protein